MSLSRVLKLDNGLSHLGKFYIRPIPVVPCRQGAGTGYEYSLPLAGGPLGFRGCEVFVRDEDGIRTSFMDLEGLQDWSQSSAVAQTSQIGAQIHRLSSPRATLQHPSNGRPHLMGVINVTSDSFYSESRATSLTEISDKAYAMIEAGASIIDIGGESSRPNGALPVAEEQEIARVVPVIEELSKLPAIISVDTRHAGVMREALAAGAGMINDINALTGEGSIEAVRDSKVPIILMHCPADFSAMHNPRQYEHVVLDTLDWLNARLEACVSAGIDKNRLIVDPGIGFVKQALQSADILARISLMHATGCTVLVGASRKSFISHLVGGAKVEERLPGSLAAAIWAYSQGVQVFRVHDVPQTYQALALQAAIHQRLAEAG